MDCQASLILQGLLPSMDSILYIFLYSTYERICRALHICSLATGTPRAHGFQGAKFHVNKFNVL